LKPEFEELSGVIKKLSNVLLPSKSSKAIVVWAVKGVATDKAAVNTRVRFIESSMGQ
jgi:hypothetical protein